MATIVPNRMATSPIFFLRDSSFRIFSVFSILTVFDIHLIGFNLSSSFLKDSDISFIALFVSILRSPMIREKTSSVLI